MAPRVGDDAYTTEEDADMSAMAFFPPESTS